MSPAVVILTGVALFVAWGGATLAMHFERRRNVERCARICRAYAQRLADPELARVASRCATMIEREYESATEEGPGAEA